MLGSLYTFLNVLNQSPMDVKMKMMEEEDKYSIESTFLSKFRKKRKKSILRGCLFLINAKEYMV